MKVRTLLIVTAIVSSILGAVVAYLVLTVPNDLQADVLLKAAREDIAQGRNDAARESLARLVQQYPRTDGAAAATLALVKLEADDRRKLERVLHASADNQKKQLDELAQKVDQLATPPVAPVAPIPPASATVTVPAPAVAAVEVSPAKKRPVRRSMHPRRSRRRRH
ncbi:MAG: hypothetical protein ABI837_09765 [Acidobacteriota bacterium]